MAQHGVRHEVLDGGEITGAPRSSLPALDDVEGIGLVGHARSIADGGRSASGPRPTRHYHATMTSLVLTLVGDDRAGLVNAIASAVTQHGGNWERSEMAELAGKFAGIVLVTIPDDRVDEFTAALEPLHGLLDVTVQRAAGDVDAPDLQRLTLDLLGTDRPGIVSDITAVLAAHDVNIESLATATREAPMAGGLLFEATAELELPVGADVEALRVALEQLANELMVDIDLDSSL